MEEAHIRLALEQESGNYTKAAKRLGISRSTLMRKLQTYSD
ncbi:MAG: helix-turn-helix domain-containing protein [Desulfobacteraceae bacterium]